MIRERTRVLEVLTEDGVVRGVRTSGGDVMADTVVLACGLWSRDLGATAGVHLPLYAAEHVHVRSQAITGTVEGLPVLRDVDNSYYIRPELDRLLMGAFEPRGLPRAVADIDSGGFATFEPNWPHVDPIRHRAEATVPALKDSGYDRFINAPESFTPDTNFLIGETAEVEGLFVAAGMNSQGVIYAPGVGRALASWITTGTPDFDSAAVDVQRFSRHQSSSRYLHRRTGESLGRLYGMHWPHYQSTSARDVRRTPLHAVLKGLFCPLACALASAAGGCRGMPESKKRKEKYDENIEEIKKIYSRKHTCLCGVIINISSKSKHEKSKKH